MTSETLKNITSTLSKNKNARLQILNYIKETNNQRLTMGKSNVTIDTNLPPYKDRLAESKRILQNYPPTKKELLASKHGVKTEEIQNIIDEMIDSLSKSIVKQMSESKESKNPDMVYYGAGISQNKETKDIYISGQKVEEVELLKPKYKEVKSRPKTLIKQDISKDLVHEEQRWKIKFTDLHKLKVVYV